MSTNHVYVFSKKPPHKFSYVAEIKSYAEGGTGHTTSLYVGMLSTHRDRAVVRC